MPATAIAAYPPDEEATSVTQRAVSPSYASSPSHRSNNAPMYLDESSTERPRQRDNYRAVSGGRHRAGMSNGTITTASRSSRRSVPRASARPQPRTTARSASPASPTPTSHNRPVPQTPAAQTPRPQPPVPAQPQPQPSPEDIIETLSLVRRLAIQPDLPSSLRVLRQGVCSLTDSARVHCLTADPMSGLPWAAIDTDDSISAFAARHKRQVCAQPAASCEIYSPDVDDADGDGSERLLIQPVVASGAVVAVLTCVRNQADPVFTQREGALLTLIADQSASLLLHSLHSHMAQEAQVPVSGGLFRGQALERHRSSRRDGALLSLSPRWVSRVYPAILATIVIALGYGVIAKVDQYSNGSAVVRLEGTMVTARAAGTVLKTYVHGGQVVSKGDMLVRMHSESEDAELGEIEAEYEQQLATFLFDPSNESAKSSLASIKSRKQKAEKVLEMRSIRAPSDGVVSDIRVRKGSPITAGDYILTVAPKDAMPEIVAFMPGTDRPRLRVGQILQLKLPGYQKAHERLKITSVGEEVIGPREARRFLGDKNGDSLPIKGSVVIVRAKLERKTFKARDKTYEYHDGMTAMAEVSVKSRRVLAALVPALEKWL